MASLKQVVDTLRREIETALAQAQPWPGGVQLEADRIIATLQMNVVDLQGNDGIRIDIPSGPGKNSGDQVVTPVHSLRLEFKCIGGQLIAVPPKENQAGANPNMSLSAPMQLAEPAAEHVTRQLSSIFGPPGFDSSARATVFREALENLADTDVAILVSGLTGGSVSDSRVKRAISLLQRVCHSGPAGAIQGKEVLARVFQSYSIQAVVQLVREIWKTQDEWMT